MRARPHDRRSSIAPRRMKDLLPLLEQVAKLGQPLAVICEIPTETSDGRRPGGMSPEGGMY